MSINFIAAFGSVCLWAIGFFAYCKYDEWKQSKQTQAE